MSLGEWQQYRVLDRQVRDLEKQQQRTAGSAQNWDDMQFTVTPTCPPSTSIAFRGGWCWVPSSGLNAFGWYIPGYTVDLTDPDKVSVRINYNNVTYTAIHPYWYIPAYIILSGYGLPARESWPAEVPDYAVYLPGMTAAEPYMVEYETAAEAEQILFGRSRYQAVEAVGIIASAVILRNNGDTSRENQWMAIDKVNRGRSYLFWTCRPSWEMG